MPRKNRDRDSDTNPECPSSIIIRADNQKCALDMLFELRRIMEEALNPRQVDEFNRSMGDLGGDEDLSLNTANIYALLIRVGLEDKKAEETINIVRTRCASVSRIAPSSQSTKMAAVVPRIAPLRTPFGGRK